MSAATEWVAEQVAQFTAEDIRRAARLLAALTTRPDDPGGDA